MGESLAFGQKSSCIPDQSYAQFSWLTQISEHSWPIHCHHWWRILWRCSPSLPEPDIFRSREMPWVEKMLALDHFGRLQPSNLHAPSVDRCRLSLKATNDTWMCVGLKVRNPHKYIKYIEVTWNHRFELNHLVILSGKLGQTTIHRSFS